MAIKTVVAVVILVARVIGNSVQVHVVVLYIMCVLLVIYEIVIKIQILVFICYATVSNAAKLHTVLGVLASLLTSTVTVIS